MRFQMSTWLCCAVLVLVGCDSGSAGGDGAARADVGEQDAGRADASSPADVADSGTEVPEDDGEGEEGPMCGLFLPPVTNMTTWTDDELESNWTYHATAHVEERLFERPFTHAADLTDRDAFERWQARAVADFWQLLRVDAAEWPDTPLMIRELESEQGSSFTRLTIDYLVEPGQRIPAYLFVPDGLTEPTAALVIWHGHGSAGKEGPGSLDTDPSNYHHEGATRLAQQGYVVLAPDVRSFGETGSPAQHEHFTQMLLGNGEVALGTFVADAMKAIDVLLTYDFVDPERIGVGGTSLGGQITTYVAALDARVRVGVVAGFLASNRGTHLKWLHCVCQYIPLIGRTVDFADAALLIAPRPVHFVTGEGDGLFPLGEAEAQFDRIQRGYELVGHPDATSFHVHPGGHEWVHEEALRRFDAVLRP